VPAPRSGDGELIACGRIGRAHGVKGEVVVDPWTDAPDERFVPDARFETATGSLTVRAAREHSGRWVVDFAGVEDRTAAEALRGVVLSVPASARPARSDPDEYYDTDLIGLAVRTVGGDDVGVVTEVLHGPGADTLLVRTDAGGEQLIPFVRAIVPTVDVSAGTIVVDPPSGLFDL
jgi:16S rRNA processing protein RimM